MTRARDLADYISTGVSDTELDVLDGVTAGTVTASKALVVDANKDIASLRNVSFDDSGKAIFGAGSDLQIYHDGSDSFVKESGTGNLNLASNGTGVHIVNDTDNETMATFHKNGASTLYYDNSAKFATTSTGIDVTGTVTADGLTVDGDVSVTGDTFTITSSAQDDPVLLIQNTTNDSNSARLKFNKDRGAAAQDGDDIADIIFAGENDAQQAVTYAAVRVEASDVSDGSEDGTITFQSMKAGTLSDSLKIDTGGTATFNSDVVASRFVDSANTAYYVDPFATSVLAYSYLQQSYGFNTALSGTTPTINAGQFSSFSLTTSGNTTFTFSVNSVATGYLIGFVLKLTAGGSHTITYPNTVDFAGGAAPDAPASGETDILVFTTIDAGTTWYGARAIDAAS